MTPIHITPHITPIQVLLVEDDESLRAGLAEYLRLVGNAVTAVGSGMECFAALAGRGQFQVAIVDLGLPDLDGKRLIAHMREHTEIRLIVITAQPADQASAESYEAGADLYMSKPVNSRELAAAVRSLAARLGSTTAPQRCWSLREQGWQLQTPQGQTLKLSAKQYQLLRALGDAKGKLVSRAALCQHLYARHDASAEAALSTQIKRLRQHVLKAQEGDPIQTAHGGGYAFTGGMVLE